MEQIDKRIYLGVIFIMIGLVWALDNIEVIPPQISDFVFRWENILILLGGFLLVSRENIRVGAILLALGVFFALDNWFNINLSLWNLWPLAFVFIGIYLIGRKASVGEEITTSEESNTVNDTAIFSGGDKLITTRNFKGGTLTAIFGGSNIDLTSSQITDQHAVIDVFYMFGGSKIRVPQDWQVDLQVTNIFGAISDKRKFTENQQDTKKLIIKGLIVFGGSEITN